MIHIYQGFCPDELQPDSRDPDCPACQVEAERNQLRAENTRLTEQLQAVSDQLTEARQLAWLWDEMGRRRISTIGFDWGVGMIMAFSSDGDCVEAETMQETFAAIEAMGDAWA